jgi:hypothetical protein
MAFPDLGNNPQDIISGGSRVITQGDKHRVFAVRKVFYDDSMTPLYANQIDFFERRYASPQELLKANPVYTPLQDAPILDNDHSLKVWNNESNP